MEGDYIENMSKKKIIIIVFILLLILGGLGGIYYYKVLLPKQVYLDKLWEDINTKFENGDLFGALDIFYNNTDLESKYAYLGIKDEIQDSLYVKLKGSLELSLAQGDFNEAKNILDSGYGYLRDDDVKELDLIYNKGIYNDSVYKVASMLYSLNLSKELVVALTDIVYTNWDNDKKLVNKDSQVVELKSKRDYAYTIFNSLGLETTDATKTTESNSKTTEVSTTTTTTETTEGTSVVNENASVQEKVIVIDEDIDSLMVDIFGIYDALYTELFSTSNDKLNYKKDIQVYSVKFDTVLEQILSKNNDIKVLYNELENNTKVIYSLGGYKNS